MITISAMQLKYGIPLLKDSQQETLEISAEIEDIQSAPFSPRYYYDGKAVHAQLVTIQGVQYYFMTSGDLVIGESVTITFLPNSKFVIESTAIRD